MTHPEVDAVVGISPSDVVWAGLSGHRPQRSSWTRGGDALPFVPYDDDWVSGRMLGFPDATVKVDLATHRHVPWDDDVPVHGAIAFEVHVNVTPPAVLSALLGV